MEARLLWVAVLFAASSAALAQTREQGPWWPNAQWGASDQAGASNWITPEKVLAATRLVKSGRVIELGHVYERGMPLNGQLTERGGVLFEAARTAACYRLFALPGTSPSKPGLLRVSEGALYSALHKLEHEGWITAEWKPSENNRRAKYYSLTARGRQLLKAEAATWRRYANAVVTLDRPEVRSALDELRKNAAAAPGRGP